MPSAPPLCMECGRRRSTTAASISTDATSALVQPLKSQSTQRQACKKAHLFTAVVRWETCAANYLALLELACGIIAFQQAGGCF
jgi:hypothetical protein